MWPNKGARLLVPATRTFVLNRSFKSGNFLGNMSADRVKIFKKIFATGLFSVTLLSAYILKKRRAERSPLSSSKFVGQLGSIRLWMYKGYCLPEPVLKEMPQINEFKFRANDVVLTAFPKTGVTWLSEIVYLLMNNLDFEAAAAKNITERVPYLEWPVPGLSAIEKMSSPRIIKTHISPKLLLDERTILFEQPRMISIIRDPKDVVTSFFFFARMNTLINYEDNIGSFIDNFMQDRIPYGPLYRFYIDLLDEREDQRTKHGHDRLLIVSYEALINDFAKEIDKITTFLRRPKLTSEEMEKLKKFVSFESMRMNPSVNYQHWDELGLRKKNEAQFMRKGEIGDHRNHLSQGYSDVLNIWMTANLGDLFDFPSMKDVLDEPEKTKKPSK